MENIKNNLSVGFGNLIGAPMQAIIEGEALAAKASADFLDEFAFEDGPNGRQLRTLTFSYEKQDEFGKPSIQNISVPFASLVKMPGIGVKKAEIDFSVSIDDFIQESTSDGQKPSYQLRTSVARKSSTQSRIHMDVKLELHQSDLSDGQIRLMNMIQNGISLTTSTPDK